MNHDSLSRRSVLNQGEVFRQGPIEGIEADEDVRRIYLGENA